MTGSSNYSFANYNSLVENTEASANAVTDALVRTIRVVHQLANSMATQEGRLHDVIGQLGALEGGTHQKQQENFTENALSRLGELELWRSNHALSYGELTDSFTALKHSVGVHAGRFERSDRHIQEWAGTLKDKERHVVENLEALRSKIQDITERHERLSEHVKGQVTSIDLGSFGDNVLTSLQELRDGGQICDMFSGDMAEVARDVLDDYDVSDAVQNALNNENLAEYIDMSDFDSYGMWEHVRDYVEEYVAENAASVRETEGNGEAVAMIMSHLKQIGITLRTISGEEAKDAKTNEG